MKPESAREQHFKAIEEAHVKDLARIPPNFGGKQLVW